MPNLLFRVPVCSLVLFAALTGPASAQHEHHDHGDTASAPAVKPPTVFLDKSPRIVWYQLNRLDNERLLLVERATDDPKYAPVYTAILTRAGMSPQHREEALAGLVELNQSNAARELISSLTELEGDSRQINRTVRQLGTMLLRLPAETLASESGQLREAAHADNPLVRSTAYAALMVSDAEGAPSAPDQEDAALDWLNAIGLVPRPALRNRARDTVVERLTSAESVAIRRAAIRSLATISEKQPETFQLVATHVRDEKLQTAAVATLLQIPAEARDPATSGELAEFLVGLAEKTPAAERTSDDFVDAMQLADQLLARLPVDSARSYRERLGAVTVRVVRIKTILEEMRYDLPFFVVEAGRPVQVVLSNDDLMPHNLVITVPGALQEVAELGLAAGPQGGYQGKDYVPESDKVLHATDMVQPNQRVPLTFTAPTEAGEYPYVCTFPRHWMRMYGVMLVVDDLDAWLQNPVEPADPIGNTRTFVQSWTIDDFSGDLAAELRGRNAEIGERLFTEATCAQCHKMRGQGGAVGPELDKVLERWKGDSRAVLHEILDPSHRIDPKYAVQLILTEDGRTISGIVQSEDSQHVAVLVNPESKEPTNIAKSEIEEMIQTSTSMMPKALLDRYTRDEILEILAYLHTADH